jgi:hypothetical protein
LGLVDSVDWTTEALAPSRIRAGLDFWNLSLSTMGFLQYLYGGNERLANQGPIRQALDRVFSGLDFHTVTPCRAIDTRNDTPLASEVMRVVSVAGSCGIPITARAVSTNISVVSPGAAGHLTLYPGGRRPLTSAINYSLGQTRANNALLPLAPDGSVTAYAFVQGGGAAHLILDVNGYFE